MVYTFKQLRDQVLRMMDEEGETVTDARVKDAMNQAHQKRCGQHRWTWMRTGIQTFTTVAGQAEYTLDYNLGKLLWLRPQGSHVPLRVVHPTKTVEVLEAPLGTQVLWAGLAPVARQPAAAGALTLSSTDAADTGQVVVKGTLADGTVIAEVVTATGTTPVATTLAFAKVLAVTKAAAWTGTLLLQDAAANVLLTLLPWEMGRQYPVLRFAVPPAGGQVIEYEGERQPLVLINDHDIPDIPGPHAQILVFDTLLLMVPYMRDVSGAAQKLWMVHADMLETQLYRVQMDDTAGPAEQIRDTDAAWWA